MERVDIIKIAIISEANFKHHVIPYQNPKHFVTNRKFSPKILDIC